MVAVGTRAGRRPVYSYRQVLDGAGRAVSAAEPISVTVASVAVRAPALDSDLLTSLTAGVVTVTGSGEPGSIVQIVVSGRPVGQALVDAQGRWTFPADIRAPGVYAFALSTIDAGGKVQTTATAVRLGRRACASCRRGAADQHLNSDRYPCTYEHGWASTTATPIPSATPHAQSDRYGDGHITVYPAATAVVLAVVDTMVVAGDSTGRRVSVGGTGLPGTVQVVVDDSIVATTTVNENGAWLIDASLPLTQAASIGVQMAGALGAVTQTEALAVPMKEVIVELPTATPVPKRTPTPPPTDTVTPPPTETVTLCDQYTNSPSPATGNPCTDRHRDAVADRNRYIGRHCNADAHAVIYSNAYARTGAD